MDAGALVREFHKATGTPERDTPTYLPHDEAYLRARLVLEEAAEFVEAAEELATVPGQDTLAAFAKELADVVYVAYGAAVQSGIDLDAALELVHASNMTKVWEDGTVKLREDGKVLKPPTYRAPDLSGVVG